MSGDFIDLLTEKDHTADHIQLAPYEYVWLTPTKRK